MYTLVYMVTKRNKSTAVVPVRIPEDLLAKLDDWGKSIDRSRSYIVRQLLTWGLENCKHGPIRATCTKCNREGGRLQ